MSCRTVGYGHRCFVQRRHRVLLRCGKAAAPAAGHGILRPGAARAFQRSAFSCCCRTPLAGLETGVGPWPRLRPGSRGFGASTGVFPHRWRGHPCHPLRQADRCRAGRCSRPCGRKPWHPCRSHPLWPCPGTGRANLCTAERIAHRTGGFAVPPHPRPAGRCLYPGRCAHDKAGGARRRAGKAGGHPHGHPMGRGRGHRQRERGAGACRPCRTGICRRM